VSPLTVLIADDHPQMLAAMVDAVADDARFTVVATATDGAEALRLAREHRVDVALLDVRMPAGGVDGITALCRLPRAPVVVAVSADTAAAVVAAALRAGATGYLAKGRIGESLADVLARCAAGWVVLATPSGAGALRLLVDD